MTASMWALVLDRSEDVWEKSRGLRKMRVSAPTLDEERDPRDAERAIVRVLYSGFCGSDKTVWFRKGFKDMIYEALDAEGKDRRIAGHELLGRVVETGSLVERRFGIKPGDVVAAESHVTCGKCLQCRSGQREVCEDTVIIGFSTDGCFAEYIKLPGEVLWPTDLGKIREEVGAVQEPFGNAVHACTKVEVRGKSVAVFGCGTIGLFTILAAKALGAARVIGVEPLEENARLAENLGADEVVRIEPTDDWRSDPRAVEKVRRFGGSGVDIAIEMAGFNSSVNNAIRSVRLGGHVVLFGIRSGDFQLEAFSEIIERGITLHGVIGRKIFETWEVSKRLLEARENGIQDKIFDVILDRGRDTIVPIAEYEPADFERRIASHPKVLVRWT